MHYSKLKKKVKKFIKSTLAALMIAGSITLPSSTLKLNAAASFSDDDFYNGLSELTSVSASTLRDPNFWSDYKYLTYPIYGTGTADLHVITKGSFETLKSGMLDCMRFAYAATGHAMYKAGLEPTNYIGNNGWGIFAPSERTNYLKGFTETTDIRMAEPGDLIEYGPTDHLAVVLGWKDGALWQIQGSAPGTGPLITKYTGYNYTPSGYNTPFYRLYHFPHKSPTKDVYARINKTSGNTNFTENNTAYSLAGAVFEVYEGNTVTGRPIATVTTDADGYVQTPKLTVSNDTTQLTIREVTAPLGFKLDTTPKVVSIGSGNIATVSFTDEPNTQAFNVSLRKSSSDSNKTSNNASYSLENAEYEIYYLNQYGNEIKLGNIKTDSTGFASTSYDNIPLGITNFRAKEIKAPKGFKLDSTPVDVVAAGNTAEFSVVDVPETTGLRVELNKKSSIPDITDGNGCYSLAGAVYEVSYKNQYGQYITLGQLTTDADGKASADYSNLQLGIKDVRVQELTAPKGYYKDSDTHDATVSGGKAVFNLTDIPANDPLAITLEKQSEDPVNAPASLAGAEFTVKYYAVDPSQNYTSAQLAGMSATRTWVITTKFSSSTKKYYTMLRDDFKVGGDNLYKLPNNTSILPLGVVTVQETKAPPGYTLENQVTYQLNNQTNEYEQTNGVAIFKVTMDSDTSASVITKNNYLYTEGVSRGGLKLQKTDTQTGTELQGNAVNHTAEYRIRNLNDYEVAMKINGNVVAKAGPNEVFNYTIVTDTNGYWESPKNNGKYEFLQTGTADLPARYHLEEVTAPLGFVIEADENDSKYTSYEFSLTEDQQVIDLTSVMGDDIARGGFSVQKIDVDTGEAKPQGDADLTTVLKIINRSANPVVVKGKTYQPGETIEINGDGNKYFTTDASGKFTSEDQLLPYGTYEIREVQPPTGYKIEGSLSATINITQDRQMVSVNVSDYVVLGDFSIYKHYNKQNSSEWDDEPEKDAVFLGILTSKLNSKFNGDVFDAYNAITDIIGDDMVADGDVQTDGTEANRLYKTYGITPKEFTIVKTDAKGKATSGKVAYGAYTIHQIKGDVNAIINDDSAKFTVSGIDTSAPEEDGMTVQMKKDQHLIEYFATNDYKTFQISIVKKDASTGKTVSYNSASFKIGYDCDNDGRWTETDRAYNKVFSDYNQIKNGFVVQTVSGKQYSVFKTYSDKEHKYTEGVFVVSADEESKKGSVTTPVRVRAGNYFIFEMDNDDATHEETPWGYVTADPDQYDIDGSLYNKSDDNAAYPVATDVQVTETHYAIMQDNNTGKLFADDIYSVRTEIRDKRVLGELDLTKTIETYADADVTLIDRSDLSGFTFELIATETIIDPADGSVIARRGEKAKVLTGGNYVELDAINTDASGHAVISNIPLGNYVLIETGHPDGIVSNDTEYPVSFVQDDNDRSTEVLKVTLNIENETTKTEINKKAVDTGNQLAGAKLTITDNGGTEYFNWTTTDDTYIVEGLKAGVTYLVNETQAPTGYVVADSVPFTVADVATVQSVTMVDKIVEVSKIDVDGNMIAGAELSVTLKGGTTPVDTWTTDTAPHRVSGLVEGNTYVLSETKTANGYVKAADVEFTVTKVKDIQSVTMTDKKLTVNKVDANGNPVVGAEMAAIDETGTTVDTWTTDGNGYDVNNLEEGKTYTIREITAPQGYVKATDKSVEVTGIDARGNKSNQNMTVTDKSVVFSKEDADHHFVPGATLEVYELDANGETVKDGNGDVKVIDTWVSGDDTYRISNLEAGKNYIVSEVVTPTGYVKATNLILFVADDNTDQTLSMIDMVVEVFKTDVSLQTVEGAIMRIVDEFGNTVDEWASTREPHRAVGLEAGKTYTLKEITAPNGYVKAADIVFTVADDGLDKVETVINKKVTVSKLDTDGNPITGAKLTVTDSTGNVIDEWLTDGSDHSVSYLTVGNKYILSETTPATGYVKAEAIVFDVYDDAQDQHIDLIDKRVSVDKVDTDGNPVVGALMQVVDMSGNPVDEWTTDGNVHYVDGLEENASYVLVEKKAANGYVKAENIDIDVTGKLNTDGDKEDQSYTMTDKRISVKKTDADGNFLADAVLEVVDENGDVVDTWTTDDTVHYVSNLEEGKTYTLKEKTTPKGYVTFEDVVFTAEKADTNGVKQDQEYTTVDTTVTFTKEDVDHNYLAGAKMEVYELDDNGDIVVDSEGDKIVVDKWTTGAESRKIENLKAGRTYIVSEVKAPDGYIKASDLSIDVNGVADQTLTMTDMKIEVFKSDVNVTAVSGAHMQVIDENGDIVDEWYSTDEAHKVSNLVAGHTYVLHEEKAPAGYVKAADITFTVDEDGTDKYETMIDKRVSVTKKDVNGRNLSDAVLTVKDSDGNVVDEWTTDGNVHYISNLVIGQTYTLYETATPDEFVTAEPVDFYVTFDDVDQTVDIVDKQVFVMKTDEKGVWVTDATMTVTDEAGNVIDEWVTDETVHAVKGLVEGKTYTLSETVTPDGYVTAVPVVFTAETADVTGIKTNQNLTVTDKIVEVLKTDMNGDPVENAVMNVVDENGNRVDSWVTDGKAHRVNGLTAGKTYTLVELKAPSGYVKATDMQIEVADDGKNQTYQMIDKKFSINKTDAGGEEVPGAKVQVLDKDGNIVDEWISGDTPHDVENLVAGETYTWHEEQTDETFGYYLAEDYEFKVTDDGVDQMATMIDKIVRYSIRKINDKDNPVVGVTLELRDITKDEQGNYLYTDEEGNPIKVELPNKGVTLEEPFDLTGKLGAGHTYELEETKIVAGVYRTDILEFTVPKYNPSTDDMIVIEMCDATTALRIHKTDEYGNSVAGAKLQIIETVTDEEGNIVEKTDEEGNPVVVYEYETTDEKLGDDVSEHVMGGETYILHEAESPYGLEEFEDITFKVSGKSDVYQIINAVDTHRTEYIKVVKVDSKKETKKLADATFELRAAKDDRLVAEGTTGTDGTLVFEVPWADDEDGYYVVETKTPAGYKVIGEKKVSVPKTDEEKGFSAKTPVSITVENEKIPETGTAMPIGGIGLMLIGAGGIVIGLSDKKRKAKK